MPLTVEADIKGVDKFLDEAPRKAGQAILRALKRGTSAAHTHAARAVSKDMGLKVGEVKAAIKVIPPTGQTLAGELRAATKRIPLIKFGARGPEPSMGRGRGVTYKTKGGRKRLDKAFIETMPSGHRGVYKRAGVRRLPIRELFGPSIGRVFGVHRQATLARGEEQFTTELNRLLARILGTT